jgi:hypothetical protein
VLLIALILACIAAVLLHGRLESRPVGAPENGERVWDYPLAAGERVAKLEGLEAKDSRILAIDLC